MPQPATRVKWNGNYIFGNEALTGRPEFGSIVAAVIAGWSITETHLGRTFATLIGAKQPVTMSMYAAARSFQVQRDLLLAVADEVLPKRYATLFGVVLTVLNHAAQDRHKFAHWVWGASADPELQALLLVEPRHFWNLAVAQIKRWHDKRNKNAIEKIGPFQFQATQPRLNHEHILVYRMRDLTDARDRIERAYRHADALRALAEARPPRRQRIYRWICDEPDIRQALEKVNKGQGNSSPTQRLPPLRARRRREQAE